ncbi:MAG: RNA polymerase sigma factor [Coprococcus sp.]
MEIKEAYEQYFNTVYGYLSTLTGGNHSLAEELTQETFYRATKKISEFRGDSKMSTWLCQIAKFVYYQSLDKKRRRKEVSFDEAVETAMHEEMQKSIEYAEAKMNIYKVIYSLSSPMRDVVMLRLTGELSFKEIGDIMSQSENWARVTFYRAKQILGKELKKDE